MALDWPHELVEQLEAHWRSQVRPRLDGTYDAWMAGVRSLDDDGLARPIHRGAEIALLRDLYREGT